MVIPLSTVIDARTWPCLASEGAVLKNYPLSAMVVKAGDVAEGEIIGTPFGTATLLATAVVTPEQSAPMIPATFSAVTSLSAAAVAAALSIQVESARTETIF